MTPTAAGCFLATSRCRPGAGPASGRRGWPPGPPRSSSCCWAPCCGVCCCTGTGSPARCRVPVGAQERRGGRPVHLGRQCARPRQTGLQATRRGRPAAGSRGGQDRRRRVLPAVLQGFHILETVTVSGTFVLTDAAGFGAIAADDASCSGANGYPISARTPRSPSPTASARSWPPPRSARATATARPVRSPSASRSSRVRIATWSRWAPRRVQLHLRPTAEQRHRDPAGPLTGRSGEPRHHYGARTTTDSMIAGSCAWPTRARTS